MALVSYSPWSFHLLTVKTLQMKKKKKMEIFKLKPFIRCRNSLKNNQAFKMKSSNKQYVSCIHSVFAEVENGWQSYPNFT